MLAGKVPFTGESPTVIMMKQVQDPPPSILAVRPELPAELDEIIKRALAKQPLDRFKSPGHLSAALPSLVAPTGETSRVAGPIKAADTVANTPVKVLAADADEDTVIR